LLNLAYLFDPRPGPLSPHDLPFHLALMMLLAVGLGTSVYGAFFTHRPSSSRWVKIGLIPLSLALLVLMAARLLAIPHLSMPVLFYATSFVTMAGWAAYLLGEGHRRGFLRRQLAALSLSWREEGANTPIGATAVLLAGHLTGLLVLSVHLGRPFLSMLGLFLLLLSPQLLPSVRARKWIFRLEALTPLWCAYLAAVARQAAAKVLSEPLPLCDGFTYPVPLADLFNIEGIFLASVVYVLLCQGYLLLLRHRRADKYVTYVGATLAIIVFLWAGAVYFKHRTHGVTANDPYAYAQMAVDIAEHGDPTHEFPLFRRIAALEISWWPVVHYGYQVRMPPLLEDGRTATDWPPGWPAILSLGYLLLGEQGLYVVNPLMGLLCLLAVFALVWELLRDAPWEQRLLGGAVSAFCLATSYEQIDRLVVPMADAASQLFTVLTLLLLLRGLRKRHRFHALVAGICFGAAYAIRHTQLAIGLCVLVVLLSLGRERHATRQRWEFVGLFGLAALLVAIPDLLYHQLVFGHFLTPESTELDLFSISHVEGTARLMWARAMSGNELGYLSPVLVYGAYRMYIARRGQFVVLLSAVLGVLAVHLPYAALRFRDLLSLLPIALAWVGYGVADLWNRIPVGRGVLSYRRHAVGTLILLALVLLPVLRTWHILPRPWGTYRGSFGYLTVEERYGFNALAAHTTNPCVVGSSLNGGPIDLYSRRQAFRPAFWSADEFDVFLQEMFLYGTNVYMLDDGEALHPNLEHARAHYRVTSIAELTVPLFGDPERISSVLYQIQPPVGVQE
jgi:hypothetical protein